MEMRGGGEGFIFFLVFLGGCVTVSIKNEGTGKRSEDGGERKTDRAFFFFVYSIFLARHYARDCDCDVS